MYAYYNAAEFQKRPVQIDNWKQPYTIKNIILSNQYRHNLVKPLYLTFARIRLSNDVMRQIVLWKDFVACKTGK